MGSKSENDIAVPFKNRDDPVLRDGTRSPTSSDGSFDLIDSLERTIFRENGITPVDTSHSNMIQEFYEGPKNCLCCINWVGGSPKDLEDEPEENEDEKFPLIVRRQKSNGGTKRYDLHSIEVSNASVRAILLDVFKGFDGVTTGPKYLIFNAPFHPFFYRWNEFENAIRDQKDDTTANILRALRRLIKPELADAFSVDKELIAHGVISFNYLWALFRPGELVYSNEDGDDQLYILRHGLSVWAGFRLTCQYVDWDGISFGLNETCININEFTGSQKITELSIFPARYLPHYDKMKEKLLLRGQKFRDLAGIHYKSYREPNGISEKRKRNPRPDTVDRRIVIDANEYHTKPSLSKLVEESDIQAFTGMIRQEPAKNMTPPSGHIPLLSNGQANLFMAPPAPPFGVPIYPPRVQPKIDRRNWANTYGMPAPGLPAPAPPPPPPPPPPPLPPLENRNIDEIELNNFHLLLCASEVPGYCLRKRKWSYFKVAYIEDINWSTEPFDNLVLPNGYKDLILAFTESQIQEGEMFDDVINGKGGGLVILLTGEPGVGKTLTAESVAEYVRAPLFKMELREDVTRRRNRNSDFGGEENIEASIEKQFQLAAQWKAVLLIDECDMYLQKRSDNARQNRVVAVFLQKLEYYPSLLFLTTNRVSTLDSALASRIHLTINYPTLDFTSRLTIWHNFLDRSEHAPSISGEEMEVLARIDINGRRIKNVVKAAQIMASRENRGPGLGDIKNVMRITEGLDIDI